LARLQQLLLFRSPHQRAKAQCKYYASVGIVVDADAAALCVPDIYHDGRLYPSSQKLLPPLFLAADFSAKDVNIFELSWRQKRRENFETRSQS
jgi:hypothetical protein